MSIIQSLEDAQRVFGELDMWTKAWTDCDGVIRWAEQTEAFKVSHEIEEEETYPCGCCDKEMALHEVNEGCDGWVCDACVEDLSSDAKEEE